MSAVCSNTPLITHAMGNIQYFCVTKKTVAPPFLFTTANSPIFPLVPFSSKQSFSRANGANVQTFTVVTGLNAARLSVSWCGQLLATYSTHTGRSVGTRLAKLAGLAGSPTYPLSNSLTYNESILCYSYL